MFERFRRWQDEIRQRNQLAQLDEADFRDLALSRNELESTVGIGPEVRDRQTAMARRHGLSEHDLRCHPQDLIASTKTCARCGHVGKCASYLASAAPAAFAARFCPNHGLYDDLAH